MRCLPVGAAGSRLFSLNFISIEGTIKTQIPQLQCVFTSLEPQMIVKAEMGAGGGVIDLFVLAPHLKLFSPISCLAADLHVCYLCAS